MFSTITGSAVLAFDGVFRLAPVKAVSGGFAPITALDEASVRACLGLYSHGGATVGSLVYVYPGGLYVEGSAPFLDATDYYLTTSGPAVLADVPAGWTRRIGRGAADGSLLITLGDPFEQSLTAQQLADVAGLSALTDGLIERVGAGWAARVITAAGRAMNAAATAAAQRVLLSLDALSAVTFKGITNAGAYAAVPRTVATSGPVLATDETIVVTAAATVTLPASAGGGRLVRFVILTSGLVTITDEGAYSEPITQTNVVVTVVDSAGGWLTAWALGRPGWDDQVADLAAVVTGSSGTVLEAILPPATVGGVAVTGPIGHRFRHDREGYVTAMTQFSHRRRPGHKLASIHVHYKPLASGTGNMLLRLDYAWVPPNQPLPLLPDWSNTEVLVPIVPADYLQHRIVSMAVNVAAPVTDASSSILYWRISRLASSSFPTDTFDAAVAWGTSQANVAIISMDPHILCDRNGSYQEYTE